MAEPERPTVPVLRLIAIAMAVAIVALVGIAVALRPSGPSAFPPEVAWMVGGLAASCLVVGLVVGATADPTAAGYRSRFLVSLALREAAGLVAAVLTLLGADVGWALGLGGAAAVSLVALGPGGAG